MALLWCIFLALIASVTAKPRIFAGEDVAPGELPYIVSFQYFGDHYCGASIVTPLYVLTATHCFQGLQGLELVAGQTDLRRPAKSAQRRPAKTFIDHEEVDIALILVAAPFEFNEFVQPILLPAAGESPLLRTGTVAGWGAVDYQGWPSYKLKKVQMESKTCDAFFGSFFPKAYFCADAKARAAVCDSDSGGPLAVTLGGKTVLFGVVSMGPDGCGGATLPDVFVDVAGMRLWIDQSMKS